MAEMKVKIRGKMEYDFDCSAEDLGRVSEFVAFLEFKVSKEARARG